VVHTGNPLCGDSIDPTKFVDLIVVFGEILRIHNKELYCYKMSNWELGGSMRCWVLIHEVVDIRASD
jgi:hypothetical protein